MGLFDEMKDKATELIQGNSDKVDLAQDKAKEIADDLDQAN